MSTEQIGKQKIRVFIAVELPASVRDLAAKRMQLLKENYLRVHASWERAEKMHLTLKFIGEIDGKKLELLQQAIDAAVKDAPPFEISINGTGSFSQRGMPRVLWLGVDDTSKALSTLQRKLESECAMIGFKKESREFHPHLTLARIRTPSNDAKLLREEHERLDFQSENFKVDEVVLMQSELLPTGSRYTKLSSHYLQKCKGDAF